MRLIRPQRRRDAEDESPCLRVSASPRAIFLQAHSHGGRCHGEPRRSVSRCMRLIRPQRCRDAEDHSPCLRVSASPRAISSPSPLPQRPMPWGATEERLTVHEVDPPAEMLRRRGLEPMSPRLRVSSGDTLPKTIPTGAHAMGGNRGACPGISEQGVLSARFSPHAAPPKWGPCRRSSRLGFFT